LQEGQRLPTEVLGIVAKYLKDEQQDRTCANLNETSKGLYAETLKDLWSVLRVRLSSYHDMNGQIDRILCGTGGKHIQYVDVLIGINQNPGLMHFSILSFFVILGRLYWQSIELGRRDSEGNATPFAKMSDLQAILRGPSDSIRTTVYCHIHPGFVFGSDDVRQLASLIHTSYGQSHQTSIPAVALSLEDHSTASAKSSSEASEAALDLTDLTETHLLIKSLSIYEFPDNTASSAICLDSLRMSYLSLLKRPLDRNNRPGVYFHNTTSENAAALVHQVYFAQYFVLPTTKSLIDVDSP
jgi:hypothetical protein